MLKFITSNRNKFLEVQRILLPVKIKQVNIDLDEIQEIDPKKIIKYKLLQALKAKKCPFIVDDSSLFLGCFNYKLPGPLIKWFNVHVGMKGMATLARKTGDNRARAETLIGYAKGPKTFIFFKGICGGKIVSPKGNYGFGYDAIFQPLGQTCTLSQIKKSSYFNFSPRSLAAIKLKKYLLKK